MSDNSSMPAMDLLMHCGAIASIIASGFGLLLGQRRAAGKLFQLGVLLAVIGALAPALIGRTS